MTAVKADAGRAGSAVDSAREGQCLAQESSVCGGTGKSVVVSRRASAKQCDFAEGIFSPPALRLRAVVVLQVH